jgi:hypothetical protein
MAAIFAAGILEEQRLSAVLAFKELHHLPGIGEKRGRHRTQAKPESNEKVSPAPSYQLPR